MSLFLVTGTSTSGKSTIAKELHLRGYEAYDTEHNGISAWFNKNTDERAAVFGQVPERTKVWMDQHEWRISMDWVGGISETALNKPIFLCGGGANEPEVRVVCDKVFWLQTDEVTIRERVTMPRDHTYGTKPHELAAAIATNITKEVEYRDFGAIMIDVTKSVDAVVNEIISLAITPQQ